METVSWYSKLDVNVRLDETRYRYRWLNSWTALVEFECCSRSHVWLQTSFEKKKNSEENFKIDSHFMKKTPSWIKLCRHKVALFEFLETMSFVFLKHWLEVGVFRYVRSNNEVTRAIKRQCPPAMYMYSYIGFLFLVVFSCYPPTGSPETQTDVVASLEARVRHTSHIAVGDFRVGRRCGHDKDFWRDFRLWQMFMVTISNDTCCPLQPVHVPLLKWFILVNVSKVSRLCVCVGPDFWFSCSFELFKLDAMF